MVTDLVGQKHFLLDGVNAYDVDLDSPRAPFWVEVEVNEKISPEESICSLSAKMRKKSGSVKNEKN